MANAEIRIFGYASRKRDTILCPSCFSRTDTSAADANILRVNDTSKFPDGLECDECEEIIFFPTQESRLGVFEAVFEGRF